jgi:hypothetical protein
MPPHSFFIIAKRFGQAVQNLGRSFEHRFQLGVIDLFDVLPQMGNDFLQAGSHFLGMMLRVSVGR